MSDWLLEPCFLGIRGFESHPPHSVTSPENITSPDNPMVISGDLPWTHVRLYGLRLFHSFKYTRLTYATLFLVLNFLNPNKETDNKNSLYLARWNREFQTLMNGTYAIILSFMSFEMSLAEIVITIPTMPAREGITNYTLSYWFVIVVVLIPLPQNFS